MVSEPRQGVAWPPQPPPFLTALISMLVGAGRLQTCASSSRLSWCLVRSGHKVPPRPVFSEAGSWRRGLAAASVSAAGGAAPAPTGQAASWSWTRWTVGGQSTVRLPPAPEPQRNHGGDTNLQAVQQHRGRLLHRTLLIGPGAAGGGGLVPAGLWSCRRGCWEVIQPQAADGTWTQTGSVNTCWRARHPLTPDP